MSHLIVFFNSSSLTSINSHTIDLIFYTQSVNHWDSSSAIMACSWNEKIIQIFAWITIHVSVFFFQFLICFLVTQLKFSSSSKLQLSTSCLGQQSTAPFLPDTLEDFAHDFFPLPCSSVFHWLASCFSCSSNLKVIAVMAQDPHTFFDIFVKGLVAPIHWILSSWEINVCCFLEIKIVQIFEI